MAQAPVNAPLPNAGQRRTQGNVPTEDTLSLKFIIEIVMTHKLWIIISLVAALIFGLLYLQRTTPQYSRYSTLLVNDRKKGGMSKGISDQIMDMGLFGGNSNVNNEMQALQSPYLMYLVIKDLNLNVSYEEPHFFRNYGLYAQNPFSVKFLDDDDRASSSFKVKILGPDSYSLSEFAYVAPGMDVPLKDDSSSVVAKAGAEVLTPIGKVALTPNAYTPADSGRTIVVRKNDANVLADSYCARLKVELPDKLATVIKLNFVDDSPVKAEDVLNSIYDMYVQEQIDKKRKSAAITSKFIDSRLEIIENELGDIDKDIEKYKSGQLLTNVGAEGLSALQESNLYGQKVLDVNNQLQIAVFIKEYLNNSLNQKPTMLPSNAGLNESSVARQIDEYNKLIIRRERLVANSSEKNPLVTEIDRNLQSMQVSVLSSLDNLIHSLEVQIKGLKGKESEIKQTIARNPKQEKYLQTVGRQQKIKEALYLFLLQKREENELSGTIEAYNLDVITPPRGDAMPISPKKSQVLLLSLLIGFGLPTFIFWLIETLDETVRGKKDLNSLTLPFLGTIPLDGKIDEKRKGSMPVRIVVKDQSRDITNESFRVLRSNFLFMSEQSGERVILFTSYFPNSGKTFLSTNLALSLALSGKRVVVADFDMRKAELSKSLANKSHGVSSYLSGRETDLKKLIVNSGQHQNFDVLPCGILPPNPAELLMGDKLNLLIDELKKDYDYVFLDSTPLNIVADAATVGQSADLVVFAIREGRFLREALPDLEQLYRSNVFKRMATVLNGSFSGSGSYGRYHRYGRYGYGRNSYGHYGQYGYGEDPAKDKK